MKAFITRTLITVSMLGLPTSRNVFAEPLKTEEIQRQRQLNFTDAVQIPMKLERNNCVVGGKETRIVGTPLNFWLAELDSSKIIIKYSPAPPLGFKGDKEAVEIPYAEIPVVNLEKCGIKLTEKHEIVSVGCEPENQIFRFLISDTSNIAYYVVIDVPNDQIRTTVIDLNIDAGGGVLIGGNNIAVKVNKEKGTMMFFSFSEERPTVGVLKGGNDLIKRIYLDGNFEFLNGLFFFPTKREEVLVRLNVGRTAINVGMPTVYATNDEIIKLAQEAGLLTEDQKPLEDYLMATHWLEGKDGHPYYVVEFFVKNKEGKAYKGLDTGLAFDLSDESLKQGIDKYLVRRERARQ